MRDKKNAFLTQAAIIAALYVVLTFAARALGLASYSIQIRFSEALCVLPFFTPAAIPGLYVGCLISNILTGANIWDIIFGSLATLIGAFGTYWLRKNRRLMTLPPVIANMLIIPFVLRYGYGFIWEYKGHDLAIPFNAITVGIGEVISVCVLGGILLRILLPYRHVIFKNNED